MPRTHGNEFPAIVQLQGCTLVPFNAISDNRTNEDGTIQTGYAYDLHREPGMADPAALQRWQNVIWKHLQAALHSHVYGTYDQGEQATILAYGARAMGLARQDIVDECLAVQNWIDSVLGYYDQRKDAIFAASTEQALVSINWDFPADMPCTDRKDWRAIRAMFEVM